MKLLKGIDVSNKIKEDIQKRLKTDKIPTLAIVRVGERPDDISYEKGATKKLTDFGLEVKSFCYPKNITDESFSQSFKKINDNKSIAGILLLRPLPKHIDEAAIEKMIDPKKDLDGISPINIARIMMGDKSGFAPCTAQAVVELLKFYNIPIKGKNVVIIGRSLVIGKPLSMLMLSEDATVTICHSKTENLKEVTKRADILVAAIGKAKLIDASYVKKNAIVIDVGINVDSDGRLCGDVDTPDLENVAGMATPVPGGIGSVTTAVLAKHLVDAANE